MLPSSSFFRHRLSIIALICFAWLLTACQPTVGEVREVTVVVPVTQIVEQEVTVEVPATVQVAVEVTRELFIEVTPVAEPRAEIGSAERPINLVVAPFADAQTSSLRAANLATALSDATGLTVESVVPADMASAIEAACRSPQRTIAILPALAFVSAQEQCGLEIGYSGVREGLSWSAGMLLVRGGRELDTLADLNELRWGMPSGHQPATDLYFQALFAREGVVFSDTLAYDSDALTMIAVLDKDVEVGSAEFKPPILPYDERQWQYGEDDPELWRRTGLYPTRSGIGFIVVGDYVENGGYQLRDARASVFDTQPLIYAATEILALSEPIPNGAVAFSAQFPLGLAHQLGDALVTFTASEGCVEAICSFDFLNWEGVMLADDTFYEPLRFIVTELAMSESDIVNYLVGAFK